MVGLQLNILRDGTESAIGKERRAMRHVLTLGTLAAVYDSDAWSDTSHFLRSSGLNLAEEDGPNNGQQEM